MGDIFIKISIRADFANASAPELAQATAVLARRALWPPTERGLSDQSLTTAREVELLATLAFVSAANRSARRTLVDHLVRTVRWRSEPNRRLINLLYDSLIGDFFDVQDVLRGSCECSCTRKPSSAIRLFLLAACAFLAEEGFAESNAGQAVIQQISVATDEVSGFAGRVLDRTIDAFPLVVQRDFEQVQCALTICLEERPARGPRQKPGQPPT